MEKYQWGTAECRQCRYSFGPHILLNGQSLRCSQCGTLQAVATRPTGIAKAERQRQAQLAEQAAPHRARNKLRLVLRFNLILWTLAILLYVFLNRLWY